MPPSASGSSAPCSSSGCTSWLPKSAGTHTRATTTERGSKVAARQELCVYIVLWAKICLSPLSCVRSRHICIKVRPNWGALGRGFLVQTFFLLGTSQAGRRWFGIAGCCSSHVHWECAEITYIATSADERIRKDGQRRGNKRHRCTINASPFVQTSNQFRVLTQQ